MTHPHPPSWGVMSASWYDAQHEPRVCELCGIEQGESQFSPSAIKATGFTVCATCVERHMENEVGQ